MRTQILRELNKAVTMIMSANANAVREVGDFIVEEFRDLAKKEVYSAYNPTQYSRTFDFLNSPTITQIGNNGVTVVFADTGGWRSQGGKGEHFYAMYGLEGGYTWGRQPSNIMRTVVSTSFQQQIGDKYLESMMAQGIPITRK